MTAKQSSLIWANRHIGAKGTIIHMHRALRKLELTPSIILTMILLPILCDGILWINLPAITGLWASIFDYWITNLNLDGDVSYATIKLLRHKILMPYPDLIAITPQHVTIWLNLIIVLLLFALSELLPKRWLPFNYLLKAGLIIQLSASLYFFLSPNHAPHDLGSYLVGVMTFGMYLMFFIPIFLTLVYYIFDISFWRKCIVTFLTLGYFLIALPFQYMLHAYIISEYSMIFMPVLYVLFGVLLDTLMFVCWYSWAMSWNGKEYVV